MQTEGKQRTDLINGGKNRRDPVAAGAVIFKGALIMLDATGFAKPADVTVDEISIGIAEHDIDNTGGGDGDVDVDTRAGFFDFLNSGGDAVTRTEIGKDVFAEDDETIAATDGTGTLSRAGVLYGFDDSGSPIVDVHPTS